MDSVQRRRETQFSMPMDQQLINAVELRIDAEETFKKQIVFSLTKLIENLEECDPSNARTTLDLTQDQLRKIIIKLNDKSNIDSAASETIANIVRDSQLLRRTKREAPEISQAPQASQVQQAPQASQVQQASQVPKVPQVSQIQRPAPLPINTAVSQEQAFLPGKNGVPPLISLPTRRPPTPPSSPPSSKPVVKPGMGGRRTRRKRKTRR